MGLRFVAVCTLGAAYVAVSQWLMTRAVASDWNAVVIVGPMLVVAALLAWQRRLRIVAALFALAAAGLLMSAALGKNWAPTTLYVAQHVAIHGLLALGFALTLQRGRTPMIVLLARQIHALTPAMEAYCRKLTGVWVGYFLAMAAASILIYATLPFAVWATFANLVTPVAVAAVFIGEYLIRYRLHPEFERATLAQAVRAYTQRHAAPRPAALAPAASRAGVDD